MIAVVWLLANVCWKLYGPPLLAKEPVAMGAFSYQQVLERKNKKKRDKHIVNIYSTKNKGNRKQETS